MLKSPDGRVSKFSTQVIVAQILMSLVKRLLKRLGTCLQRRSRMIAINLGDYVVSGLCGIGIFHCQSIASVPGKTLRPASARRSLLE